MAILKAKGQQTTSLERQSEGADVYLKALRDGTLSVASWIGALSLEGRVFTANAGSATTYTTFGAGGLDESEFDLHVAVPASVVIIPLDLRICFEAYGTALLVECNLESGSGSAAGAGTTITPVSSNINAGITSACTVIGASVDGTAITINLKEIWRADRQIVITTATVAQIREQEVFTWHAKDSGILDIVGPSQQLGVHASAATGTGFICLKYAELPASAVR